MGTIPRIVAHLDLDGAGIATGTALGEDEKGEFVEQRLEASGQRAKIPGGKGKSGITPVAVAQLAVPALQRRPAPPLQMSRGTSRSTLITLPSQLKAVRRAWETAVWPPVSILISTYCAVGSPFNPDITSSMLER